MIVLFAFPEDVLILTNIGGGGEKGVCLDRKTRRKVYSQHFDSNADLRD